MTRRAQNRSLRLLGVLLASAALAACSSGGCYDNQSAIPLAAFYDSASDAAISLSGIEIAGVGAPGDSVLVPSNRTVAEVYLPMRATAESVSWRLRYDDEGRYDDLITFGYTSQPYFASDECGAFYRYRINRCDYTTNVIDSVVVTDSLVTNVDMVRIKIYLDTALLNGGGDAPDEPGSGGEADGQ